MSKETDFVSREQETLLLQTFSLIRRVTARRLGALHYDQVEDVTQKIILKLLQWKKLRGETSLSKEAWLKFANKTAQNAVKDFYAEQSRRKIAFSEIDGGGWCGGEPYSRPLAGNTRAEIRSLLVEFWNTVQNRSFRERAALLLKRPDVVSQLIFYRCCRGEEVAALLEMTKSELENFLREAPPSDEEIARWLEGKLAEKLAAENVAKARKRVSDKLREVLIGTAPCVGYWLLTLALLAAGCFG